MKNKKFLKKLTATALGLGLGVSSMASVGAISPKSLWEKHIQNQSRSDILQKYNQQIKSELDKNLSSHTERYVADFFLNGEIPEFSNSQYLNPYYSAIAEAREILNGKHLDPNDDKATVFKEYVFQKLLYSQGKISEIRSDVRNKNKDLEKVQEVSLKLLNKYPNDPTVKNYINQIKRLRPVGLALVNMILNNDASLKSVNEWKNHFDGHYNTMKENEQQVLAYINNKQENKQKNKQAEIDQIRSDVRNKNNDLERVQAVSLKLLNKYSNDPTVKDYIEQIGINTQKCPYLVYMILNADASLEEVNGWKRSFDLFYNAMKNNEQQALAYIKNEQAEIDQIKSDVRNKNKDLEKVQTVSLGLLNEYSNDPTVKNYIKEINRLKQTCLTFVNSILNADASLEEVSKWKNYLDLFYNAIKNNEQEALAYINNVINNSNMPGKTAAPTPMISNQINSINNAQAKKDLEDRFERLSSGNQQISGPCWLYATTTAINEFRDRTNSGPIIKRPRGDYREYGPVEIAYTEAGFENPLSINANGPNGKGTQAILDYARAQGLEARNVWLFRQDNLGMNTDGLVKLTADLLKEHFKYHKSPVLVEAPWGGEFHELTIAGIVGNELLVINSFGDSITWQPISKLSDYCKNNGTLFNLVFFGDKETKNSKHGSICLAGMQNTDSLNKAKNNLLQFARGDFNIKSLI